ncbi:FadR/GntR family transcriptional regulator [Paraburkholderia phosphatilytica]|uniref:FadR/GntR family transcriptional regulator n=1 Tax=Paraburkholderia phosphatilytica TaxID=2282883 RepID=UPI000E49751E|nr:FCD domain-containing protein [Paraburkholderia phosphatilytica]
MEQGNKDRSLVSKVMDGLVTGIVEDRYGAVLPPQDVLSKDFDVSRTVMREALSMLLARDMLDVRPKIGTRIRPMRDWRMIDEDVVNWRFRAKPDPQFLRDVIEFRVLIEPRAAAQAAVRGTAADIAGIREAFEAVRAMRPDEPGFQTAEELLHTRIVVASGNQFFQQMAAIVRGALSASNPIVSSDPVVWQTMVERHARVVDAIERHDPREAEAASLALIDFMADKIGTTLPMERPHVGGNGGLPGLGAASARDDAAGAAGV